MRPRKRGFTPYRDQVDCAKRRILGYLEREHGAVQMGSIADIRTLHKSIWQPRDLGRKYDQQCKTLKKALDELLSEGKIAWDESRQMVGVTYAVRPRKSNSSQRYANRRMRRAVA